ncbi:radical SAM protein [Patescibacteria group bacterium]|nr:radical SAM protein [Patescibacteria group bacterium]
MKINGFSYKELFNLAIQKPILAQLEITQNCNQECSFCFKKCSYQKKYKDFSLLTWKKIVKNLSNFGVTNINFTGGEVFLYRDFIKLVDYSKKNGIKNILVNTNGSVPLSGFDLSKIDSLVFSVHDIGEKHDSIVGLKGAFNNLVKNLKKNIKRSAINVVITDKNIDRLDDVLNYFKKFDLQFFSFNLAGDINGETKISKALFKKYLSFLKKLEKCVGDKVLLRHGMQNIVINDKKFFEAKIPLPHCAGGKYKLLVDYQGDVYPCSFFQNDNFYCGNILNDNLADIWKNGKGFIFFRKQYLEIKNLPNDCKACFKKDKCGGGCFVWRSFNKKTKKYEKDIRCDIGNAYLGTGNN